MRVSADRFNKALVLLALVLPCVFLPPSARAGRLEGLHHPLFGLKLEPDIGQSLIPVLSQNQGDRDAEEADESTLGKKIVVSSLVASGIFLCSWGITSWQRDEDQCCPAENTDNVAKIVIGIVLINAGLVYFYEAVD